MNCYFLSPTLSHLKINGEYAGEVDKNLIMGSFSQKPFIVEFLPFSDSLIPSYSHKNSKSVLEYVTPDGGYLYYPIFRQKRNGPLKVILQKLFTVYSGQITVTVTDDNGYKFYVDGAFNALSELPFLPNDVYVENFGDFTAISFQEKKTALFIYRLDGNLEYFDVCDEFSFSNVLSVKKRHRNLTLTTTTETWSVSSPFKLISITDEKEKDYRLLPSKILPLAFFENALIGGTVNDITTVEFSKKTERLREFLGKVYTLIISPTDKSSVWLLGEKNLSVATLSWVNGLIDNVFIDDF